MKKQFKLGVIGCGFNSTAILRGVVLSDFIREKKIIVSDKDESKLDNIEYLGVKTTLDNRYVAQNSEYLILAVNEKNFKETIKELEGIRPEKVISVICGISKNEIKNSLGIGVIKVARAVMNLPCSIGSGTIGLDMVDYNKLTDDTEFITNIFDKLGTVVSLEESKLDAVSAISGNSVYPLFLIDSLINAGVKNGLTKGEAKLIATQSVLGIAELIQREEQSIDDILLQNCKNGSPAIESVKVFEDNEFRKLVSDAAEAYISRLKSQKT